MLGQARIDAKLNTVTEGAEESRLDLQVQVGGTLSTVASVFSHATRGKGIELIDDGQLGSVGTPDAMTISSTGVVAVTAHDGSSAGLKLGTTLVTATGAELNYLGECLWSAVRLLCVVWMVRAWFVLEED